MHFSGVKFSQEDLLCVKKLHSTTLELQAFKVCECRPFFNCHTCTFQLELKIWRKIYSDKEYSRWILLSMPKRKKLGTSWFFFHLVFVVYAWLLSPSVTDCCCLWPTNNMDFANLCYFCYLWSVVTFESNKQIMWIRWSCPTPLLLALTLHLRAPPFPKSLHTFQQTASKLTAPRKPFF